MEIEVELDDLLQAGFVPYRYLGTDLRGSGTQKVMTHGYWMVHGSVVHACEGLRESQNQYPVLMPKYAAPVYSLKPEDQGNITNVGQIDYWEAKWGAQYFRLRTYNELNGFMQLFNYQPQSCQ